MRFHIYNYRIIVYISCCLFLFFYGNREVNASTVNIEVSDIRFTPGNIHVVAGDTIRWIFNGTKFHTTTCDGVFPGTLLPPGALAWNSTLGNSNPEFKYIVAVAGTYVYVSIYDYKSEKMTGTIIAESSMPVELTDFVATTIKNEVILDWVTGREINNDRFEIQRIMINENKEFNSNDLQYKTIGFLLGNGSSNEIHNYKYIDKNLKTGTYLYRLMQVDYNSNIIFHLLHDEVVIGIPGKFMMSQNYPNPFNPMTRIDFDLPENGFVTISLFDISGKIVSTVLNSNINAGYQSVVVNVEGLSSGVYYYRIEYKGESTFESNTKKMMVLK